MPRYYNKTRGPLPLSLPSGPTIAPPKSYIDIPISDEGCASVIRNVKKGFLVPPILRPAPVAPAPKMQPAPAPKVDPEPVKEDAPAEPAQLMSSDEVEAPAEDSSEMKGSSKSGKKTTKKRTRR